MKKFIENNYSNSDTNMNSKTDQKLLFAENSFAPVTNITSVICNISINHNKIE